MIYLGITGLYLVVVYILWLIQNFRKYRKLYILAWKIPGPIVLPIVGNYAEVLLTTRFDTTKLLKVTKYYLNKYSPIEKIFRVWLSDLYVLTADAQLASEILSKTLVKSDVYLNMATPYFERSLLLNQNITEWKTTKKLITPSFNLNMLKTYLRVFHEESLNITTTFDKFSETFQSFYPPEVIETFTYNSVLRNLTGLNPEDPSCKKYQLPFHVNEIFKIMQEKITNPALKTPLIQYLTGKRQHELHCIQKVFKFCRENFVSSKFSTLACPAKTITQKILDDSSLPSHEMHIQILTLIAGGLDTTMTQNSVILLMLALHPEVQQKVHAELTEILGNDPTICPSYENLMKLEYLDRFLKECLRMFPSIPMIARKTIQEETFLAEGNRKHTFPNDTNLVIMIGSIHRRPEYYENPNIFDPDRWLPDEVAKRNPHCYIPFSSGYRNCPGGKYAMIQMRIFASTMVRSYEVLPSEECQSLEDVEIVMNMTAALRKNCKVRLKRRV